MGGTFSTVTFTSIIVGTLTGGASIVVGNLSDLVINVDKDWDTKSITNFNTLEFTNGIGIYPDGANSVSLNGTFRITGDLVVDGSYPGSSSGSTIVANGNTLTGVVTFDVSAYSTIGVSGNVITIGSTIPNLQDLSGTITDAQHTNITHNLSDLTIDADKDWAGKNITNVGTLVAGEASITNGTIMLGADVNFYRMSAGVFGTDDDMITAGYLYTMESLYVGSNDIYLYKGGDNTLQTPNVVRAGGYVSSDGSVGISQTVAVGNKYLIIKNGLIVGVSIPTGFPYILPFELS